MKKVEVELAWAYIKGQKVIDAFDKRAANNLLQCIALGRELDLRSVMLRGGAVPPRLLRAIFARQRNS
jgi:hypothetical protein